MQGIAGICIDPKSAVIFFEVSPSKVKKKKKIYTCIIFSYLYEFFETDR